MNACCCRSDRIKSGYKRVIGIGFFKDATLESFPEHEVFQVSFSCACVYVCVCVLRGGEGVGGAKGVLVEHGLPLPHCGVWCVEHPAWNCNGAD